MLFEVKVKCNLCDAHVGVAEQAFRLQHDAFMDQLTRRFSECTFDGIVELALGDMQPFCVVTQRPEVKLMLVNQSTV